jgi:hypothetical protein
VHEVDCPKLLQNNWNDFLWVPVSLPVLLIRLSAATSSWLQLAYYTLTEQYKVLSKYITSVFRYFDPEYHTHPFPVCVEKRVVTRSSRTSCQLC